MLTDQQRRLDCATSALKAYHANDGVDSSETCQFIDLFADLLHLAQSMGIDGEDCYRIGRGHFGLESGRNAMLRPNISRDDWSAIFDAIDHAITAMGDTLGDKCECDYYEPEDLENMRLRQADWMRLLKVISPLTTEGGHSYACED